MRRDAIVSVLIAVFVAIVAPRTLAQSPTNSPANPQPAPVAQPRATPWDTTSWAFSPTHVEAPIAPPPPVESIVPPPAPQHVNSFPLETVWENGLWFQSPDKQFRIHVGGNAQIDSTWLIGPQSVFALPGGGQNGIGNSSAVFLRRARFRMDGDIYQQFDYMVEYDFAHANNEEDDQPPSFQNIASSPVPCNIWMQVRDVPFLGNVRAGNQVKPIGMPNNTYQGFLPFMERADNQDGFYAPFDSGFALGVSARNWSESERMTWQTGIYGPSINVFGVSVNKYSAGGRTTALPVYEDDGKYLVHVGLGSFGGEMEQNMLRVRARPALRNGPGYAVPILVDTGEVPGSRQYTICPEFAAVAGPWTFQAEWSGQLLTNALPTGQLPQGDIVYHGGYAEALLFLTGEHQEYEKREGVFGRVTPLRNYSWKKGDGCCGCGAWQVGLRFSYLDLNDKAIQGGLVYDWTAGVNWFLNPNMKFQFNYILEHRDQPGVTPGWINGAGLRAAFDF